MTADLDLDRAIAADEIGIATARQRGTVLRSAFQLVYAVRDGALEAVAAEAYLRPMQEGEVVPPLHYLNGLEVGERGIAARLALDIHRRNHRVSGLDSLDRVLALGPGEDVPDDQSGAEPAVICRLRNPLAMDRRQIDAVVSNARARKMRLAFSGIGFDQAVLDRVRHNAPDIVAFDAGWFRRVAASDGARSLLARLVEALKAEGMQVLVPGIEAQSQLRAALDAGADLVQGFALSRPALAGSVLGPSRIPLAKLQPAGANVIPLFAAHA